MWLPCSQPISSYYCLTNLNGCQWTYIRHDWYQFIVIWSKLEYNVTWKKPAFRSYKFEFSHEPDVVHQIRNDQITAFEFFEDTVWTVTSMRSSSESFNSHVTILTMAKSVKQLFSWMALFPQFQMNLSICLLSQKTKLRIFETLETLYFGVRVWNFIWFSFWTVMRD